MSRQLMRALAVVAGTAVLVGAAPAAHAAFTASGAFGASAAIGSLSLSAPASSVVLSGAGGTTYAAVDLTNTSDIPMTGGVSVSTALIVSSQSVPVTATARLVSAGTECAAPGGASFGELQQSDATALPSGAGLRYCMKLEYDGLTSAVNGVSTVWSLSITGKTGSWTVTQSSIVTGTVADAPDPTLPPVPTATCGVGYLLALTWPTTSTSTDLTLKLANGTTVPYFVFSIQPNEPRTATVSISLENLRSVISDPGVYAITATQNGTVVATASVQLTQNGSTWSMSCATT
jgi:hypothetical protein